jgi:hypothetical protein
MCSGGSTDKNGSEFTGWKDEQDGKPMGKQVRDGNKANDL